MAHLDLRNEIHKSTRRDYPVGLPIGHKAEFPMGAPARRLAAHVYRYSADVHRARRLSVDQIDPVIAMA